MSCLSSAEAVVISAGSVLTLAKGAVDRVGDALAGRHPIERQQAAWDANAGFVASLGLDPAGVLGARPAVSEPAGVGLVAATA